MKNIVKKYLLPLSLALVAGLFSSCTKTLVETIVEECPYQMKIVDISVPQASWQYSNFMNNNYFYAAVDVPEINEEAFRGGMIKMYRTFNYNDNSAFQMEIPYIRHTEEVNDFGEKIFFTETVDYDFGIGDVNIYYTVSNFSYEYDWDFVPEPMTFRCVIMY